MARAGQLPNRPGSSWIIPARGALTVLALDHGQSPPGLRGFAQPAALTLMQIKE